jgi:hypothetical protein
MIIAIMRFIILQGKSPTSGRWVNPSLFTKLAVLMNLVIGDQSL